MIISFRRYYLDQLLARESYFGNVLDVGGERANPRGTFRPPLDKVTYWKYLSVDPQTKPDFLASADSIPVEAEQFDRVHLCEVLEHLENPEKALKECQRVLRQGGIFLVTIPFLYPVHGDPQDYQRWTPTKLRTELQKSGFRDIEVQPMGGFVAVVADMYEMWCSLEFSRHGRLPFWMKCLRFAARRIFLNILLTWDKKFPFKNVITSGYYVTARKA